jgi:acetylornithine deacetylase
MLEEKKVRESNKNRVIELTSELIKFNTTNPDLGSDPFQDKECQNFIANFLKNLGFSVDLWEPDLTGLEHFPFFLRGQDFHDRPQLAARLKGSSGGRSLILNAHIDVVPAERKNWKHDPWGGQVEDEKLYGRGACDMKGGAAAILAAVESLVQSDFKPRGDIIVETVLDEEINGMGTVSCIQRGYKADAALIPEPSNLNIWAATRGIMWSKLTVNGRAGHAELEHPHWEEGGAVNAIEKMMLILDSIKMLECDWAQRSTKHHPLLSMPRIMPTVLRGGNFWATIPDKCQLEMDVQYLPSDKDVSGYGTKVKREINEHFKCAVEADSWLRENPPKMEWLIDLPPMEISKDTPLIQTVLSAADKVGIKPEIRGFNSWYDGAHLMNLANIPSVAIGPGPIEKAHMVDEFVTLDTLTACADLIAEFTMQWTR